MAWFKVDDKLWGHPKWLAVPPRARGLWVTAGSWSAANETDGEIPRHVIATLGGNKSDAQKLCDAGLWRESKAGWVFHEWSVYQPDAASLKAKRSAEADGGALGNHRRWHMGRNIVVPDCDYCQGLPPEHDVEPSGGYRVPDRVPDRGADGVPDSPPNRPVPDPTRTRPVPEESKSISSEVADATPRPDERPDVDALLDYLDERIESNGAKKPNRTKKNRDAIRLLIDKDGRTPEQVRAAIDFATNDEFWRSNILSASKLREKYQQLAMKAKSQGWKRPADRHERRQQFWEAEMAKAESITQPTNNLEIEAS